MAEDEHVPQLPPPLTVLLAINGSMRSLFAVLWALEKFAKERVLFKLLHVFPTITTIPTDLGNHIPISGVRPDIVETYEKEMEWERNKMLHSYERLITERKVKMEVKLIEADDVPQAIAGVVAECEISKLVIGASSTSWFTRVFKGQNLSSRICKCVPSFCSVYVVSKGEVIERPSTSEADRTSNYQRNDTRSSTNTGSCSSSQPGAAHFEALSSIIEDIPFSRSNSVSPGHPISALDREEATPSRSNNSFKFFKSRSSRTDLKSNSDLASSSSMPSSLERHFVSPSTPRTRMKERKQ